LWIPSRRIKMTVTEDATIRASYTGDGSQDTFAYTWKIYANTELLVYVLPDGLTGSYDPATYLQTITTHYTVTGVAEDAGGNVVFESGSIPANNSTVLIVLDAPYEQATDYQPAGAFPAKAHEDALDKVVWLLLCIKDLLDRMPRMAVTVDDDPDLELAADATGRANQALAFDAAGDLGLYNLEDISALTVSAFAETLLDDITPQAFMTTLCVRKIEIQIEDATTAGEIKVSASDSYGWNSEDIAAVDDIGKDETKSGINLNAAGTQLKITDAALSSGNVQAVLSCHIGRNGSTSALRVRGWADGGIVVQCTDDADGTGAAADLTSVVDGGVGILIIQVLYLTAS
jgi:hypothetical protein